MTDPTPAATPTTEQSPPARRRFLGAAVSGAAGAVAMAAPMVSVAQSPVVFKMQGAWGAKDIFNEMAEEYVKRVNEMSGGRLRIDYLVGGAVVKPFEVMDATSKGVLDACHGVPVYWYGKSKVASLFGSGPINGCDAPQTLAWIYRGGGLELYQELLKKINLDVVGFFAMPMPTQPLGWFKKPIKSVDDLKGMKYRTVGLAADLMQEMGMKVTQLPGGEIVPAMDRGVIEAFEFNNPTSDRRFGAQDVAKYYMMGSFHQAMEFFEIAFNTQEVRRPAQGPAGHPALLGRVGVAVELVDGDGQLLARPGRTDRQGQGHRAAHAEVGVRRADEGLGRGGQEAQRRGSLLQEGGRQPEGLVEARGQVHVPQRGRLPGGLRAHPRQDPGHVLTRQYLAAQGGRRASLVFEDPTMIRSIIKTIDQLNKSVGHAFAWCIVILTLGVSYEVFVRYALRDPTSWAFDLSYILYGALFLMSGAYTLSRGGHVRADIFYRRWRPRTQATLEFVLYLLFFFPGVLALVIAGWGYGHESFVIREVSVNSPVGVPIWPLKTADSCRRRAAHAAGHRRVPALRAVPAGRRVAGTAARCRGTGVPADPDAQRSGAKP